MMMLPYFVIIPLLAAFLIALFWKRNKHFGDVVSNLAALALLGISFYSVRLVAAHKILVYKMGGWQPPMGISLVVDGLSSLMLVTVSLVSFMAMIYSVVYMNSYTDKWKYYSLLMLMLAGLNGVIISGDLFNLYVFLEVASIAGYALVAFGIEAENLEASFKYAIMGVIASIFILLGIGLLYSYTSTLNLADISLVLSSKTAGPLIGFISALFLAGFGLKAAIAPFHAWLPDAHSSAPTPVSAILSGVFIKTLGIYALIRVFVNTLGLSSQLSLVFMIAGVLSMVVGAFLAVGQNDIKRMLAYSSISQIGYIVLALGIGSRLAILGGIFFLFSHAVSKSLLFLNAGSIEYATGQRSLKKLSGLNSRLPITGFTGLLGSMSISGIPPLGGFWAKLIIIIAAVQAGYLGFAAVAALVSIVTLVYYLKFQSNVFFGKLDDALIGVKEVAWSMRLAMVILAIICVFAGLLLIPRFNFFISSAVDVLTSGIGYRDAVMGALR